MLGSPVTLKATVSGTAGDPAPTGWVTFESGSGADVVCAAVKLSPSRPPGVPSATCTTTTTALGAANHTLFALYSGDGTYENLRAGLTYRIPKSPVSVVVTDAGGAGPVPLGTSIELTATVTGSPALGVPGGTMSFATSGGSVLCSGEALQPAASPTASLAKCAINTSILGAGNHGVIATYSGSTSYATGRGRLTLRVV
jgi:hypothetical protein